MKEGTDAKGGKSIRRNENVKCQIFEVLNAIYIVDFWQMNINFKYVFRSNRWSPIIS